MPPDFDSRLQVMAEVIVRVGLNLQPGQPLLITDPYDLQGVHPETEPLMAALRTAAAADAAVLPADPVRLRSLIEADDLPAYESVVTTHTHRLQKHLARGGAFLFLTGTAPQLFTGLPADRLARFNAVKWRHLGPLIQQLIRGATQWTLFPAPTSDWAAAAGVEVSALWETVFQALRIDQRNRWPTHLATLSQRRDELNAARHRRIRYHGPGTDLILELPRSHVWCTAQLSTQSGISFVANLPTEEIFTAPHQHSATGTVRVGRPVSHGGSVIDGIELDFRRGRVARARAKSGEDLLHRLLATDPGAARIGEAALLPGNDHLPWTTRHHHHTLLDENSCPHIALGESYRFCSRAWWPLALNSSQLHLDLPLDAEVELS